MQQERIRVLYPEWYPATRKCYGKLPALPSISCAPGFMVEIIAIIAEHLKLEIVPVVFDKNTQKDDYSFSTVVGNQTNDLLSYITDGVVDTIAIPFHSYGDKNRFFDVSAPVYNTTASFFYYKQFNQVSNWLEFFRVYNKSIWMALGLLFICVFLFLYTAKRLEIKFERKGGQSFNEKVATNIEIFWLVLLFILGHTQYGKLKSNIVNVGLLFLSFWYCFVVLGLYGSWILSLKLKPAALPPIRNLAHLAKLLDNKEFQLIATEAKADDFEQLYRTKRSILRDISESLDDNPIILVNASEIVEKLTEDAFVVYSEADEQLYLDLQMHCGISEINEHVSNIPAVLVFKKGSPFAGPFNRVLHHHRAVFIQIINRYLSLGSDKINDQPCKEDRASQRLPYFGLCFMVVGIGLLGVFILLIENIAFYAVCTKAKVPKKSGLDN